MVESLLFECLILLSQSQYFLLVTVALFLHLPLRPLVLLYRYLSYFLRLFDDVLILSRTFQALFSSFRGHSILFHYARCFFVVFDLVLIVPYDLFHLLYFAHLPSQLIGERLVLFLDEHVRLLKQVLHLVLPTFGLHLAAQMTPLPLLVSADRLEFVLFSRISLLPPLPLQ